MREFPQRKRTTCNGMLGNQSLYSSRRLIVVLNPQDRSKWIILVIFWVIQRSVNCFWIYCRQRQPALCTLAGLGDTRADLPIVYTRACVASDSVCLSYDASVCKQTTCFCLKYTLIAHIACWLCLQIIDDGNWIILWWNNHHVMWSKGLLQCIAVKSIRFTPKDCNKPLLHIT